MKIAVIGAGAIGSVVAAYLQKAGEDVVLIGRQDQVDVISKNGLLIKGARGEETFPLKVLTRLDKNYDLVIFATKTQDLETAYQENNTFLEDVYVLTTQNGVQADNILSSHFDREKMYSSIVMFGATYVKPGEITLNFEGDWIIGKPFLPFDPQGQVFADVLGKAFRTVVSTNITGMKYLKLFVNFNNCLPAVIGQSMQETFADIELCKLSVRLLKEGLDVVKKIGIEMVSLPDFPIERVEGLVQMPEEQAAGILNKTLTGLSKEPLYGSILQSIKRGKPSEIDFINGEVVHLAHGMQAQAPLNEKITAMVHQVENNGKYFDIETVKEEFSLL